MTPILGIIASSFRSAAGPDGAYDSLATITVPSGGLSSITFAGIPNTYKHLQIRGIGRDTQASGAHSLRLQLNSDTGSNYTYHALTGDGSSASAGALTGQSTQYPGFLIGTSGTTGVFAASIIDILDYANTSKNKVTRTLSGVDNNGSGSIGLFSGMWLNVAAITSITLLPAASTNFAENSTFTLYGVR
jgi:hypothetical protein